MTAANILSDNDARPNDVETESIQEPLSRILERMSPAMVERYQAISDPIALVSALGFWGVRVYTEYQAKQSEAQRQRTGGMNRNAQSVYPTGSTTPESNTPPGTEYSNEVTDAQRNGYEQTLFRIPQ